MALAAPDGQLYNWHQTTMEKGRSNVENGGCQTANISLSYNETYYEDKH